MTPFERARDELRSLNISLTACGAEYALHHMGASRHTVHEFRTDHLEAALEIGREMAKHPPGTLPPLGPMGTPATRKAKMYRHNRKVAARRAKRQRS